MDNNHYYNQYTNPQQTGVPYVGYYPVTCPRCGRIAQSAICPFCGLDLSKEYVVKSVPDAGNPAGYSFCVSPAIKKKSHTGVIVGSILGGIGFLFLIAIIMGASLYQYSFAGNMPEGGSSDDYYYGYNSQDESQFNYSPGLSRSEYNQIKVGYTYAQVSGIAGGDGTVDSYSEETAETVFVWVAEDDDTKGYYITFKDGKVTDMKLKRLSN